MKRLLCDTFNHDQSRTQKSSASIWESDLALVFFSSTDFFFFEEAAVDESEEDE